MGGDKGDNRDPDITEPSILNLKIGEQFVKKDYCWVDSGSLNCGDNEFVKGDRANDCTCKDIGDRTRNCKRYNCKRTKFNGDPLKCCLNSSKNLLFYRVPDGFGTKPATCNHIHRTFTGNGCDDVMIKYCKTDSNLFTTECKDWYQAKIKEKSAKADDVILEVCNKAENIFKPECGCVYAVRDIKQKLPSAVSLPVECIHVKCVNEPTAFKTLAQYYRDCNIVNCEINIQDLKIISAGNSPITPSFSQKCGEQQPKGTSDKDKEKEANNETNKETTYFSLDKLDNTKIFIIIGVVFLVFLMIGVVIALKNNNNLNNN